MFFNLFGKKNNDEVSEVKDKTIKNCHELLPIDSFFKVTNFVAFDFETAKSSDPCQLGIAVVRDGKIVQSMSYLIRPIDNEYDYHTIKYHKITPDMTENSPSFPVIWEQVKPIFDNSILVAHNASFDISVLKFALDYYQLDYPSIEGYLCTCDLNNREGLRLACARYGIDLVKHHDGEDDAINCAKLYLAYVNGEKPLSDAELPAEVFEKEPSNDVSIERHAPLSGDVLKKDLTGADPSNPFYDRKVVISGVFERFADRDDLAELLKSMGADMERDMGAKTNFLIVGTAPGPSKISKAEDKLASGKPFRLLHEDELYSILDGNDYEKYHIDLPIPKSKMPVERKTTWPNLVKKYQSFVDGDEVQFTKSELESEDFKMLDLYYHQQQQISGVKSTVMNNVRLLSPDLELQYKSDMLQCFSEGESLSYEEASARVKKIFEKYGLTFQFKACALNELGIEYELFKVKGLHHWKITKVPQN